MKYALIIASGAADAPLPELDGLTPMQAASTPTIDRLARSGRVGAAALVPEGVTPSPEVALAALLGIDPLETGVSRGGLASAGQGVELGPRDWAFALDLVHARDDGTIVDASAGGVPIAEASALFADLMAFWRDLPGGLADGLELHAGTGPGALLIDRSGREYPDLRTVPAWETVGEAWDRSLPMAPGGPYREASERLSELIARSYDLLAEHEINTARAESGLPAANLAWISGQGQATRPSPPDAAHRLSAALIGGDDLARGIARLTGMEVIDASSAELGPRAVDALDRVDLVVVHTSAPRLAAERGDWTEKVDALSRLDARVVAPIAGKLETFGDAEAHPERRGWRIMVLPEIYQLSAARRPDATPVPFAMAGAWVRSVVPRAWTEAEANESDLRVPVGHELLEYFLRGGLAKVRPMTK